MMVFVPEIAVEEKGENPSDPKELLLDGGFVVPDSNAFGKTFRYISK